MTDPSNKPENPLLNLGLNVILPALVLMKGKSWLEGYWGGTSDGLTVLVFVLALSMPLLYGIYDLIARKKWNFFSILGLVGVLLTGGIGLLKLPPEWVAIKEATIPGLIGLAFVVSQFTRKPLIGMFLFKTGVFDINRIEKHVQEADQQPAFDRLLRRSNGLFAGSFFLSAMLNFVLAKKIVVSPAGSDAFNEELGRMTLLSYPVIVIPSMIITVVALWLLFSGIEKLTGLSLEELIAPEQ